MTVEKYINSFSEKQKHVLRQMRSIIKSAAPQAEEGIGYGMPVFKLEGVLVYYAIYKAHIGFYPTPSGVRYLQEELADYKFSKGAIQFPLDKKLPAGLIKRVVKFRAKENLLWAAFKKKRK